MLLLSTTLLLSMTLLHSSASSSSSCTKYGEFEGSEDSTLWKGGLAFQSSGLERAPFSRLPVGHQGGKMLMVDLRSDATPVLHELNISGMPADLSFHPHGLHLDNVTQRLFAVCHAKTVPLKGQRANEESVVVFDIVQPAAGASGSPLPSLRYAYALKSPLFQYYNASFVWFLNDVAVVDGANELYVTQLGPLKKNMSDEKTFFRCTWDESKVRSDGRLPADCAVAYVDADGSRPATYGLNGINIDGDFKRLFVNNMYGGALWVFDRAQDGSLSRVDTINLAGWIDNVERDHASGDLTGGMFANHVNVSDTRGGNILVRCTDKQTNTYAKPTIVQVDDSPKEPGQKYQVSTSLTYGNWTILGSPTDSGLVICHK